MSSLTVLCPNARRQTIKVQQNTKILEILEEVCKKQGLPSNEYDLVFQKKHLDLTLTYRLSGIPNNAQLELSKLESGPRQISDITIVLQLDDGTRLPPQQFKPDDTSLFSVIHTYLTLQPTIEQLNKALDQSQSTQTSTYPVVTYLNDQVVGHFQLKNTTLLDLGLASGRFILRLSERKFEEAEFDKLDVEFRKKLEKKSKLEEIYNKKQLESSIQSKIESETKPRLFIEPDQVHRTESVPRTLPEKTIYQEPKKPKIEPQYQVQVASNEVEYNRVNEFENFKFPEETRGQNLNSQNELAEIERESREACDRMPVCFSLRSNEEEENAAAVAAEEAGSERRGEDVDDEFFNVTVDDLRCMLNDLKRLQNDEAPLMTREMREIEKDKRAMKYSKVAIRVSFKNGNVLQGLFRPKENVSELYKFVKSCLSTDCDFQLFISPPRTILNDMKRTLFDLGLCPAAFVYFKSESMESKSAMPNLKPNVRITSLEEANEIVNTNVHQAMRKVDHEGLNWLEKENTLVQNILSSSSLRARQETNNRYVDFEADSGARTSEHSNDAMRKKFEKFFGAKK